MKINHPAYSIIVERSGIVKDGVLCGDYVNLVRTALNKLIVDMVKMANGVQISSQLSPGPLNCSEIKKEQLAEGLYSSFY